MLKSQKISVELSQVRSKLLDDDLESEERDKLVSQYQDLESRHAAAIVAEGGETPDDEKPAPRDLVAQVDIAEYAAAAVEQRSIASGPARELAEELDIDTARAIVPWAVLADGIEDVEERADAPTTGPTAGEQSTQHAALRRIFKGSLVDQIGVNVVSAGAGKHSYPILGAGASAAWYAKSAEVSSTAATITAVEASPTRLSSRYSWTRESALEFSQLADLLRNDLRQVMIAKGADVVINGTGTSPEPGGIFSQITAPQTPTVNATIQNFRDSVMNGLGNYASTTQEVRLFLGVDAFKYLSGLSSQTGDLVGEPYIKNLSDLRISNVLADAPSSGGRQGVAEALTFSTRGTGSGLLLWWHGGVELVADSTSGASKAEVYLTAMMFGDTVWRTTAPYKRASFKIA